MIVMAQQHAQEFASRATQEAIEQRSQQRSHFAAAPTEDSNLDAAEPALPSGFGLPDRRHGASVTQSVAPAESVATAASSAAVVPPAVSAAPVIHPGPILAAAADLSDGQDDRVFEMQSRVNTLSRELAETQKKLARICAQAPVVRELDLVGLSELRAELVQNYTAALERIDDRRVELRCKAEAQKSDVSGLCVACLARNANALLQPCRHMCVCTVCAPQCGDACPLCRRNVQGIIEVVGVS